MQNFGPFPLVTIGGLPCLSVANVVGSESTRLTCQLPEGTGTDLLVVVKQGNFFSRGQPLVSFGRPLVQVVRGCPTNDLANTADCVRAGGNVITLSGEWVGVAAGLLARWLMLVRVSVLLSRPELWRRTGQGHCRRRELPERDPRAAEPSPEADVQDRCGHGPQAQRGRAAGPRGLLAGWGLYLVRRVPAGYLHPGAQLPAVPNR